jgi:hypothetical protein
VLNPNKSDMHSGFPDKFPCSQGVCLKDRQAEPAAFGSEAGKADFARPILAVKRFLDFMMVVSGPSILW